jgi:hypothetical protein
MSCLYSEGVQAIKTQEQKDRARDKRLQKTYRITLADRQRILEAQGNKCGICGRVEDPADPCLQVDHEHFKIESKRLEWLPPLGKGWASRATFKDQEPTVWTWRKTKAASIQAAKDDALPLSVRGLLCRGAHGRGCNTKLGRADDPSWQRKAIQYLENPPARAVLQKSS